MPVQKTDKTESYTRKSVDIENQHRMAEFRADTINEDKRTVDVVFSTGARVMRFSFMRGRYVEELSLDPKHMDLSRLNGGAPCLDSHSFYQLSSQIGVVERAWVADGVAMATIRLSSRDDVEPIWQDIRDGIIRNVSIGYSVQKYEVTKNEDKPDEYRAVEWQPFEISFVTVPADADAGVRQNSQNLNPCILEMVRSDPPQQKGIDMPKAIKKDAEQTAATENRSNENAPQSQNVSENVESTETRLDRKPKKDPALEAAGLDENAIRAAERQRVTDIQAAGRSVGLDDAVATRFVEQGLSVDESKVRMHDEVAKRQELTVIRTQVEMPHDGQNEDETRMAAMQCAIAHRANYQNNELTDAAREYRGMSLVDIARDCIVQRGGKVRGLTPMEIVGIALNTEQRSGGMMGTSDFPIILGNTINRTLRSAYDEAPRVWERFTRRIGVKDFKQIERAQIGGGDMAFEKVNEHGEFKRGSFGEASEKYKIDSYGRIIALSRQAIINDDMSAFDRIPQIFGRKASDFEGDMVMAFITGNYVMGDGTALFHSDHKNLATGALISVASLGKMRTAMRTQTGLSDDEILNLIMKFLLVPAALETDAEKFLSTNIVPAKAADENPFKGKLELLVDPRLDAVSKTSWYIIADPMQIDTIELAHLEGQEGMFTETRHGFNVDGVEIKVRIDRGGAPIDHRGFQKNPN
ncbi:MAG: peptidase U37 [Alphaproteobacteria bacterium]|nr:MAG: peptidase U37 [Alphaproteobacteria bacterium]